MSRHTRNGGPDVLTSGGRHAFLGVLTTLMLVFSLVAMAGPAVAMEAEGAEDPPGQCVQGYTKIVDDYQGGASWVADADYESVILAGGTPGDLRDVEFTDVKSGETLTHPDFDISHICAIASGDDPEDADQPVIELHPIFECWEQSGADTYTAYFGYENKSTLDGAPYDVPLADAGFGVTPVSFESVFLTELALTGDEFVYPNVVDGRPGRTAFLPDPWVSITDWDGSNIVFTLDGRTATSSTNGPECESTDPEPEPDDDVTTPNDPPSTQVLAEEIEDENPCFDGTAESEGDVCVTAESPESEVAVLGVQIESTTTTTIAPVTADTLPFTGDDTGIQLMWGLWALAAGVVALGIGAQRSPAAVASREGTSGPIRKWIRR